MVSIVGLTGNARAGKDYSAIVLKDMLDKHGISSAIVSSSDPVREHAAQQLSKHALYIDAARSWVNDDEHKDEFKEIIGMTPRQFTCLESDKAKKSDPFFFIKQWKDTLPEDVDVIINPSIRTCDEADMVNDMGGFFIEVHNPLLIGKLSTHFTDDSLGLDHVMAIENAHSKGLQNNDDKVIFESCIQSAFKYTVEMSIPDAIVVNDAVLVPSENELFKGEGLYEIHVPRGLYGVHLSDAYQASKLFSENALYHIDVATLVKRKVNFAVVNELGVPIFSDKQMSIIDKATRDNMDCLSELTKVENGAPVLSEKDMEILVYEGLNSDMEPS